MKSTFRLCGLLVVILTFIPFNAIAQSSGADAGQKAVLITGASTGIGRKITEVFAEQGYFVYAGARKQQDLDALKDFFRKASTHAFKSKSTLPLPRLKTAAAGCMA